MRLGSSGVRTPTLREPSVNKATKDESKWDLIEAVPVKCRRETISGVEEKTERSESDHNTCNCLIEEEVVRKARIKNNEGCLEYRWEAVYHDAEAPRIYSVHLQFPVPDGINGRSTFWLGVVV